MRNLGFAVVVSAFALAAQGCSKTYSIAKSGEAGAPATQVEHEPVKLPSVITGNRAADPIFNHPILGDVDGDGFDDFLLQVSSAPQALDVGPSFTQVYLFYGRAAFPAQFTIADADAEFESAGFSAAGLGDINGDGLADFSLGTRRGCNLVFGSNTRYAGKYAPGAVGTTWSGPLREGAEIAAPTMTIPRAAGDVNGDGADDLWLTVTGNEEASALQGYPQGYLVLGHAGIWESGEWDTRWAAMTFGTERVMLGGDVDLPLLDASAADLDGDGFSDLLLTGQNTTYVFYGRADLPSELGAARADAALQRAIGFQIDALADLDGDGMDELAISNGLTLAITYGSRARLRGMTALAADLTIRSLDTSPPVGIVTAATGDLDGDGAAELVISARTSEGSVADAIPSTKLLYTLRNRGMRALGEQVLSALETRPLGPETDFGAIKSERIALYDNREVSLSLSGDIDGDGASDILTEGAEGTMLTLPGTTVTLIPSVPRDPD